MSVYTFKLPDLGEGTVESEIVEWRVRIGDWVDADQALVDVMTDKATVEITAPVSGKIVSLAGEPGDMVAVGSELVVFDTAQEPAGEPAAPDTERAAQSDHDQAPVAPGPAEGPAGPDKPQTSPAVRKIAKEHDIDLTRVPGTGPKGRITRDDITRFMQGARPSATEAAPRKLTGTREIKVIGLRRRIAERMSMSARRIPHFSYVEEIDVSELERLRGHLNGAREPDQPKLSYLPFFMRALVKVLKAHPQCNAHFDDEREIVTEFDALDVGIATQTDRGLLVPVIRHVETLDLWACAEALQRATARARSGEASREELSGSTITITSLGALGGISSTPIINYPEVAVIGINKAQQRPVIVDGGFSARLMMNVSASFDHRIIDGHVAARAIQALKTLLEHPATIFM